MGNGAWGMGEWGNGGTGMALTTKNQKLRNNNQPITNYQLPITHYQLPIPHSPLLPITHDFFYVAAFSKINLARFTSSGTSIG
jgi:hypothetical protein